MNKVDNKFRRGDVTTGKRLHDSTATLDNNDNDDVKLYKVEGKIRPMLVIAEPKTHVRSYNTLDFTSKKPDVNDPDFLLKENGAPRPFGSMLGFNELSYLRIYPISSTPESAMKQARGIEPFSGELFRAIIKEVSHRMLFE